MDVIIPTVLDCDLSSLYWIEDESPPIEYEIETREIIFQSLRELSKLRKQIIVLLMMGYEPKNVAKCLGTNEMAITRARRSFEAKLHENGYVY